MAKKAKSAHPIKTRRKVNESSKFTFSTPLHRSQSFTKLIAHVRASKSLKDVIEHLDLTFSDFGRLLGKSPQFSKSRPAGYSAPYLSMLINGERVLTERMIEAMEWSINKALFDALGVEIGVSITRNSPWRFRLAMNCAKHGVYEIDGRRKRCPKCRR